MNDLDSLRSLRNELAHNELIVDEDKMKAMRNGIWSRSINRNGKVVEEFPYPQKKGLEKALDKEAESWYQTLLLGGTTKFAFPH